MGKDKRAVKGKCKNTAEELKELFATKTGRFYIFVEQDEVKGVGSFTGYVSAFTLDVPKPRTIRVPTVPKVEDAIYFETVLGLRMFIDVTMEKQKCVKSYKIERV